MEYVINEEVERKHILREYRSLLRSLKHRLKKGDKELLRHAFEMAAEAHKEMRRKSGEPYILHPIAVAKITVDEIGLGVTSAICALLHDTVEDTEITLEDLERDFGSSVAKIIDGLTKISNFGDIQTDSSSQIENFKKILFTLAEDPRVILIKIADRLHNMRTMDSMRRDKQLKIASETAYIYAPLAHRLGLYEIKSELEDLALKFKSPEIYTDIARRLNESKRERTKYVNEFIKPLKEAIQAQHFNFEIYGRPKSINSIYNKMRTKQVTFEEVYDLFAIRIILDVPQEQEKESCWRVYSIITNFYKPSTERLRDWISVPKGNGYEALHTTVMGPQGRWVEVQIRSKRMNEIAEKGLAAHWKYKEGNQQSNESKLDQFLIHIGDVLRNEEFESRDFLQDIKLDLFTEEIYIYTPKGEMRVLPKGATALDFAFDVHSELGAKCIGAKVNFKLVPLSYVLKSGDQVEIITSSKQKPNEDWLNFVSTTKAKSRIKYYLKEERRAIGENGKEILARKLRNMHVAFNTANIQEIVSYFKFVSPLDLYVAIAQEKLDLKELKHFVVLPGEKLAAPLTVTEVPEKESEPSKEKHDKSNELIIFGEKADRIQYTLANCCQPIPGDDVFGFISSQEGLKIHRTDCKNAARLLAQFGHRVVRTKWAKHSDISFLTAFRLTGLDDVGIIQSITNIISAELKMNMRSISVDSKDGVFEGVITIYVKSKEEFEMLKSRLEAIPGITKVERIDDN